MGRSVVYLDNHSTTRVDPRVTEALLPFLSEHYGNPSNRSHPFGREAAEAVSRSLRTVGRVLRAPEPNPGIYFTSGATESNNLALCAPVLAAGRASGHVITQATEHPSVLECAQALEARGCRVTYLGVDANGLVDPGDVEKAIARDTKLVSIMMANNEVGVLQPVAEIGRIARSRDVLFHCDAAQAVGKVPVDVGAARIDLLSISAHKIHGPKGVGALYVGDRARAHALEPLFHGGGQQDGLRAGTMAVPLVVALAAALDLVEGEGAVEAERLRLLRDRLVDRLGSAVADLVVHGPLDGRRLPNNLSVAFPGVEADALLACLDDVALSSGSACASHEFAASHVLTAMGVTPEVAQCTVRFGLGRFTTGEDIDYAARRVVEEVERLRRSMAG